MAFVDLEKSFDNTNWKILFDIMENVGIDSRERNCIQYTEIRKLKFKLTSL